MKRLRPQLNPKSIRFLKTTLAILLINLLILVLIILFQKHLPPTIPLFYGKPTGEEQLAPRLALAIPHIITLTIIIINSTLINLTKNSLLHQILIALMVVATILSTITVLKIALLVGSF
jgi:hypothetical protein